MRHFEQSLAVASRTGLPLQERLEMIVQVDEYVLRLRDARPHDADGGRAQRGPRRATSRPTRSSTCPTQLATGEYPNVEALLAEQDGEIVGLIQQMIDLITAPERFERGLQRLLDGFQLEIEKHNTA